MNKTELFQYIKTVRYPYWDLSMVAGFKNNRLRSYKLEDIDEDAKPDEKLNASLNALEITLSSFKPTDKFTIILKNSETANGSGVYGPIEFINMESESAPLPGAKPQTSNGFGGFAGIPDFNYLRSLGYVPESEYTAKLEAAKLEQQKAMMEMEFRLKEEAMKRDFANKKENLRRQIAETQRQREEANNGINKLVEVVKLAAPSVLGQLFGIDVKGLAGPQEQTSEVTVKDPKYMEVEALATELYDSGVTAEDVSRLRTELKLVNYELSKTETDTGV